MLELTGHLIRCRDAGAGTIFRQAPIEIPEPSRWQRFALAMKGRGRVIRELALGAGGEYPIDGTPNSPYNDGCLEFFALLRKKTIKVRLTGPPQSEIRLLRIEPPLELTSGPLPPLPRGCEGNILSASGKAALTFDATGRIYFRITRPTSFSPILDLDLRIQQSDSK